MDSTAKTRSFHLTPQELIKLAFDWEEQPTAEKFLINRDGENITVTRDQIITQVVQEFPNFKDAPLDYFNSKNAWQTLRITASAILRGEPPPLSQPNQYQMAELERRHAKKIAEDKIAIAKIDPSLTPKEVDMVIKVIEEQKLSVEEAVDKVEEIFQKTAPVPEETVETLPKAPPAPSPAPTSKDPEIIPQTTRIEPTSPTNIAPIVEAEEEPTLAQKEIARLKEEAPEKGTNVYDVLRQPDIIVKAAASEIKTAISQASETPATSEELPREELPQVENQVTFPLEEQSIILPKSEDKPVDATQSLDQIQPVPVEVPNQSQNTISTVETPVVEKAPSAEEFEKNMAIAENLAQGFVEKSGDISPEAIKQAREEVWQLISESQSETIETSETSSSSTRFAGTFLTPPPKNTSKVVSENKDGEHVLFSSEGNKKTFNTVVERGNLAKANRSYSYREMDKLALREISDVGAFLKAVWRYRLQEMPDIDQELDSDLLYFPGEDIEPNTDYPIGEEFSYQGQEMSGQNLFVQMAKGEIQNRAFSAAASRIGGAAAGTLRTASVAGGAVAATGATTAGTAAVAAGAAPPVAAALALKTLLSKGLGAIKGFFNIFAPNFLSKAKIYGKKGLGAILSGDSVGNILMLLGFGAGFAVGGPAGALILAIGGKLATKLIGGILGMVGSVIPGSGDKKKKGLLVALGSSSMVVGGPAAIAVGSLALLILFFINQFFVLPGALRAAPENDEDYGPPPLFEIKKTAECKANGIVKDCKALPNDQKYEVQYAIEIKSLTNQPGINPEFQGKDLKFQITDAIKGLSEKGELEVPQPVVPGEMTLKPGQTESFSVGQIPEISFSGVQFNDSVINNTVTAIGTVVGTSETQTQASIATVIIGNPKDPAPYEFPIAGFLSDIDDQPIKAPDGTRPHRGWFETLGKTVDGGTDIVGSGNVVSTIDGIVVYAEIHAGKPSESNPNCTNYEFSSGPQFTGGSKCLYQYGVGGAVYIRSRVGQYLVAYLHLDTPQVKPGDVVERGKTVLGQIYPVELPTTSGAHVHYQVLKNGGNLNFADSNNAGLCSQEKIEKNVHKAGDSVPVAPTTCD